MNFAVVIEGMTIAAFIILIAGGKQRREQGWGVMAIFVALAAVIQMAVMALIVSAALRITILKEPGCLIRLLADRNLESRPTFSSMTIDFSLAGSSIRAGLCVQ